MTRASDTARLVSGGAVFNEASNDVDFRVESNGNANMLFVDAGNDSVKLGTTSDPSHGTADSHVLAIGGKQNNGSGTLAFIDTAGNSDALLLGDSGNLTINVDSSNATSDSSLQIRVDNSEKMRIDSSGNVLIGETSQINGGFLNLATSAASNALSFLCRSTDDGHQPEIIMQKSSTNSGNFAATADNESLGRILFRGVNTSNVSDIAAFIEVVQDGTSSSTVPAEMRFGTTETERMRVTSSGRLILGGTSDVSTSLTGHLQVGEGDTHFVVHRNDSNNQIHVTTKVNVTFNRSHYQFQNPNGTVGSITTLNSATSFNTSSDYRLKENVVTDWDATTRLKQLKPSRFNFKANKDITVDGFLAHEVSGIVPEAITGEKDEVNEKGEPVMQGIDQSKLVPLLTKSLQEALARIDTLEAEVKTLKGE